MAKYLKIFTDAEKKYQKLSDAEFGRLIRAGLHYKETGEEIELTGRESLLWDGLKLDIDRDTEKYGNLCAVRSAAGQKGAAARWQTKGKNSKSHLPYSKNDQDKDKEEDKEEEYIPPISPSGDISPQQGGPTTDKRKRFVAPSVDEVRTYCADRGNHVDPQRFVDFYTANGWTQGRGKPIKDWRAAVRTWESRDTGRPAGGNANHVPSDADYDLAGILGGAQ